MPREIVIYGLYRLLDIIGTIFDADSPHRIELEKSIHNMLYDLENDEELE